MTRAFHSLSMLLAIWALVQVAPVAWQLVTVVTH